MSLVIGSTTVQRVIPNEALGRVSAVFGTGAAAATLAGAVGGPLLAQSLGMTGLAAVASLATLAAAGLAVALLPAGPAGPAPVRGATGRRPGCRSGRSLASTAGRRPISAIRRRWPRRPR
jgi:predicted MFS family arabinose efflux permease